MLPLWQGKQYVAARDDITGAEWALNSSADAPALGAGPRRQRLTPPRRQRISSTRRV